MSPDNMINTAEALRLLKKGISQSEIARKMHVSRQAVHQLVKEFIKNGEISEKRIVRYKRAEKKPQPRINPLLTEEYAALRKKYLDMYQNGAILKEIMEAARTDGLPSYFRAINDLLDSIGIKRGKGIHAKDQRTGEALITLFAGKKFAWDTELVLLEKNEKKPEPSDVVLSAKELYEQFCRFAEVKYITYTKWLGHIESAFKQKTGKRSPWFVPVEAFIQFLNEKFTNNKQVIFQQRDNQQQKEKKERTSAC
jgi:predicted DNA-binding protein YlxM (UPF0122 family)